MFITSNKLFRVLKKLEIIMKSVLDFCRAVHIRARILLVSGMSITQSTILTVALAGINLSTARISQSEEYTDSEVSGLTATFYIFLSCIFFFFLPK